MSTINPIGAAQIPALRRPEQLAAIIFCRFCGHTMQALHRHGIPVYGCGWACVRRSPVTAQEVCAQLLPALSRLPVLAAKPPQWQLAHATEFLTRVTIGRYGRDLTLTWRQ